VRFTRDVDLAITAADDADVEQLVHSLGDVGYFPVGKRPGIDASRFRAISGITLPDGGERWRNDEIDSFGRVR
jgi:hypothetical protein